MRRWDSVESGDFDLIVAKYYLQSIAQFGDSSDIEFIEWIDSNAEERFHPEDFESQIRPLMETVVNQRDGIDGNGDWQDYCISSDRVAIG
jgi:hypothetical protein